MSTEISIDARPVAEDTVALTTFMPLPGMGMLPINAFVVRAEQPVLVDAGMLAMKDAFFAGIADTIDLDDLRWIWLTHADADHLGALHEVLEHAPNAKVATTFLAAGKLGLMGRPIPEARLHLIEPGARLDVGDRRLVALRPPVFDAPETVGLFDTRTRNLISSDSFGGLIAEPAQSAAAIDPDALREGMVTWALIDAPWLSLVDRSSFRRVLDTIGWLRPEAVLSSHLPAAPGMTDVLVSNLLASLGAAPAPGQSQEQVEEMLAAK